MRLSHSVEVHEVNVYVVSLLIVYSHVSIWQLFDGFRLNILVENFTKFLGPFELSLKSGMKNGVFWDVTPRGSCKNRRFGGT
jgi:hypothetical protein